MARVIQKYGGTSVGDIDCIRVVANKIRESASRGNEIVAVVSARAGVTDRLISYAKALAINPNAREFDALLCTGEQESVALLSIALNEMGIKAVSLLAFQVGILTCSSHGNARIKSIDGQRIEELLAAKNVVIVAGFQGISEDGDLTTIGRGGSDLTALALAHRLGADRCEIYTDVTGVHTGDPKIIENAQLIENIDFESLLRLSFFDNKIMQDRSIALAQKKNIPFTISNTFSGDSSKKTSVSSESNDYESTVIGVTNKTDLCLISCESTENIALGILEFFEKNNVSVGFIKHRRIESALFFDEISLNMFDFQNIKSEFRSNFRKYLVAFTVIENLSRIDIIGTNIQASEKALRTFGIMANEVILRSEYGKHGLSFLVQVSGEKYKTLLNEIHSAIFPACERK
ncbi:MAG: aspartate kinase [Puniceicoccales bacterium]|jgi:aspartate kinase|nr:aspartate kinase [Puniceicoccales bacterium]